MSEAMIGAAVYLLVGLSLWRWLFEDATVKEDVVLFLVLIVAWPIWYTAAVIFAFQNAARKTREWYNANNNTEDTSNG